MPLSISVVGHSDFQKAGKDLDLMVTTRIKSAQSLGNTESTKLLIVQ